MWDFIPTDLLIAHAHAGNYGLAIKRWETTIKQIRQLPETADRDER